MIFLRVVRIVCFQEVEEYIHWNGKLWYYVSYVVISLAKKENCEQIWDIEFTTFILPLEYRISFCKIEG